MGRLQIGCLFTSLLLLSGCPDGTSSRSNSSTFNNGLTANIQANIHEDDSSATIAAAVFQDGARVNLIAADVFEATVEDKGVLLKSISEHTGDYVGTLPVDNTSSDVRITIEHKPIEAREDRWYPVDVLNVDPGPGELVGHFATVSFPANLSLLGPSENSTYINQNDVVDITWEPAGNGDDMRLSAAVMCSNSNASLNYGLSYALGDDDGLASIAMNKLVYNDSVTSIALAFVEQISRIFLAAALQVVTFGLVDAEDLSSTSIDIETASCDIDLTLIREKLGNLDPEFDGGQAIGSTSASTTILYRPNGF